MHVVLLPRRIFFSQVYDSHAFDTQILREIYVWSFTME
jgi:hypothetical protein